MCLVVSSFSFAASVACSRPNKRLEPTRLALSVYSCATGRAAQAPDERGLDARDFQRGRMARLEFRAQHRADQVHAGPALFGVVADHG